MEPHRIALIKPPQEDIAMELLLLLLLVVAFGAIAQVGGTDSRDMDPRVDRRSW
jgi:hypothetical protein